MAEPLCSYFGKCGGCAALFDFFPHIEAVVELVAED